MIHPQAFPHQHRRQTPITVVRNGAPTIDHQEIEGITGGALDANEGEPGPLLHSGRPHRRLEIPQHHGCGPAALMISVMSF
jgi:hypothetical protein